MSIEMESIVKLIVPSVEAGDFAEPENLVATMFKQARYGYVDGASDLAKASWNDPMGGDRPAEKRTAETKSTFLKGTAAHKMGLTRIEQREIDGDTWSYGFRGNELVDVKLLSIGA